MKFLVDESVSRKVARVLRDAYQDARHCVELGLEHASDVEILQRAVTEQRILITADLDFGAWLALWGEHVPSVIQLRRVPRRPEAQATLILGVLLRLERDLEDGALVVIDGDRLRIRPLPIRPRPASPNA